jgi:hypothetical protein
MLIISILVAAFSTASITAQSQLAPPPFKSCIASSPQVLGLEISGTVDADRTTVLDIAVKNISEKAITIEKRDPERLFAAKVADASEVPVPLTPRGRKLYAPTSSSQVLVESSVGPLHLEPQEEASFKWRISDIFEMSKPGLYKVSLMEAVSLVSLNTVACSNVVSVNVKP